MLGALAIQRDIDALCGRAILAESETVFSLV
jgi:hypothetical protein